jgi:hypothetical protein
LEAEEKKTFPSFSLPTSGSSESGTSGDNLLLTSGIQSLPIRTVASHMQDQARAGNGDRFKKMPKDCNFAHFGVSGTILKVFLPNKVAILTQMTPTYLGRKSHHNIVFKK